MHRTYLMCGGPLDGKWINSTTQYVYAIGAYTGPPPFAEKLATVINITKTVKYEAPNYNARVMYPIEDTK